MSNFKEMLTYWFIFNILIGLLGLIFLYYYLKWHWSRRYMYYHSSKVPGPIAFPFVGSAHYFIGGHYEILQAIRNLFEKYPKLFRIWVGPKLFYGIAQPKHINIILNKALQKEDAYKFSRYVIGTGLFSAPLDKWKKNRKLLSPTFNQKIIDGFVQVFNEQCDILNEQIKKHCCKNNVQVFDLVSRASLDIICETAMGYKGNAQTTNSPFGKWVDSTMVGSREAEAVLPPLANATEPPGRYRRYLLYRIIEEKSQAFDLMKEEGKICPEAQLEENSLKGKVFLDYLLEISNDNNGSRFTNKELMDEVITFIIADKVFEEVMEVIGPDREIEHSDIPKLKYLERVIKETLRLFPVAAIIVRVIETDLELEKNLLLPAGSATVIGIFNIHRNPELWPEPLKFDPDRFLPENMENQVPGSYIPFSLGPRNCIGGRYAMTALTTMIAGVVRKYKIYSDYKKIEDIDLKMNLILRPNDGFKIRFEERAN